MPTPHTVQPGECISSIAEQFGFFPDTIWNDSANARLKQLRRDPNILFHGDSVVIPDKRTKEVERPTDAHHRFRKKGTPARFRLQVFDGEEPRANQHYSIWIDNQTYAEDTTNGEGVLELDIPPNAREGKLTIGPDAFEVVLQLGHLAPVSEVTGVQQRLNNLGYECGPANGTMNDRTASAIRRFQRRFNLAVTGEVDDATRQKLAEVHDGVKEST